jgi:conjugal transfer pilus assembly protein TraW
MAFSKDIFLILWFLLPVTPAYAKDLGSIGTTYPIVETNLIADLQGQIDHDKVAKVMEEYKKYKPTDLHVLPKAVSDRTFQVDMTYTLDHDIQDENGRILYKKGLTWNPLEYVTFPGGLVVINGEDANQLKWFETSGYAKNHRVKLMVTSSNAASLIEELHRPVFYLNKVMATRLQLAAVPSVVIQEGKKMTVQEVKVEDK